MICDVRTILFELVYTWQWDFFFLWITIVFHHERYLLYVTASYPLSTDFLSDSNLNSTKRRRIAVSNSARNVFNRTTRNSTLEKPRKRTNVRVFEDLLTLLVFRTCYLCALKENRRWACSKYEWFLSVGKNSLEDLSTENLFRSKLTLEKRKIPFLPHLSSNHIKWQLRHQPHLFWLVNYFQILYTVFQLKETTHPK